MEKWKRARIRRMSRAVVAFNPSTVALIPVVKARWCQGCEPGIAGPTTCQLCGDIVEGEMLHLTPGHLQWAEALALVWELQESQPEDVNAKEPRLFACWAMAQMRERCPPPLPSSHHL